MPSLTIDTRRATRETLISFWAFCLRTEHISLCFRTSPPFMGAQRCEKSVVCCCFTLCGDIPKKQIGGKVHVCVTNGRCRVSCVRLPALINIAPSTFRHPCITCRILVDDSDEKKRSTSTVRGGSPCSSVFWVVSLVGKSIPQKTKIPSSHVDFLR